MKNIVFRGPPCRDPITISRKVAGAYHPGIAVTDDGTELTAATNGAGRLLFLDARRFYDQDADTAYTTGETAVAHRVLPEDELSLRCAAAAYTRGQELTVGAGGVLTAAATGNLVVAFFDEAGRTLAAIGRADVVIANRYTKP